MNELMIFESPVFGQVRTMMRDDDPWFVASDVCRALEIGNPTEAIKRLDGDEKALISIEGISKGNNTANVVSEPGLYSLVLGSRKPEARAFKRWITHEVLPALRKTGTYSTADDAPHLRAQAMLMNAKTRQYKAIMQTLSDKPRLAPIAVEVFGLKALQTVTGVDMGNYLPETERTYSATEVGEMYGVSSAKVGKVANLNNVKRPEYGKYVLDKSPNSAKQVETFRYNAKGVDRIGKLLGMQ
jgi:prophage antirepressor-like protein